MEKSSCQEVLGGFGNNLIQMAMGDPIWASMRGNLSSVVFEQQRSRPACTSAQSDQRLCYLLIEKYHI